MTTATINDIIARWDSGDGKPYKGSLIDWDAYQAETDGGEGDAPIGCMCAQGQMLYFVGGWSPQKLRDTNQAEADKETAKLLGISRGHAVLLRNVNDSVDGAPSIVLTDPAKVIGDQAETILAFWRHLDAMTAEQWDAAWDAAWAAARDAAWDAAWAAARAAAGAAAGAAARDAAWAAAGDAARAAARAAAQYVTWEIQGAAEMRKAGHKFYFLPMFGFTDPEAVMAWDKAR